MQTYDVAIVGGGITGCALAFELSRYHVKTALLERSNDVAAGATRANSGIVHAGYDPEPGTLMARCNVEGNALIRELAPALGVSYRNNGSLVVALSKEDLPRLKSLYDRGIQNGVPGLELLSGEEARRREPHLADEVAGALYAPTAGIISPWEFALALAETAVQNGCRFLPEHEVVSIRQEEGGFRLTTAAGQDIRSRFVVNAAGPHGDRINDLIAPHTFEIHPSRGQYYLLDKAQGDLVGATVFQCPSKDGKGVLVAPTVHGNLIVGPDAVSQEDPDDTAVTAQGLAFVAAQARRSVPGFNLRDSIRNFAGVRAVGSCPDGRDDFIVGEAPGVPGFFNLCGIKSPGLTSAPSLAKVGVEMLGKAGLPLEPREDFRLCPRPRPFRTASDEERAAMAAENPLYGRVVCRCETVTEGEVVAAAHEPIPAVSVDGVKRRCNAGMGRCQGGFCGPRVTAILAREMGIPMAEVPQDGPGTHMLTGRL